MIIKLPFILSDLVKGKYQSAGLGIVSALISTIPVYGTAASIAIDVVQVAVTIKENSDQSHKLSNNSIIIDL